MRAGGSLLIDYWTLLLLDHLVEDGLALLHVLSDEDLATRWSLSDVLSKNFSEAMSQYSELSSGDEQLVKFSSAQSKLMIN